MQFTLKSDIATTFSLAAQQNSYPLIKNTMISYSRSDDEINNAIESLDEKISNICVHLSTVPEFIEPEEWLFDELKLFQSVKLQERPLKPHYDKMLGLTEEIQVHFIFNVSYIDLNGQTIEQTFKYNVSILPANYWGGESRQAELLAAFVQPNVHTVEMLTSKVSQFLKKSGNGSSIAGYQSNTREQPFMYGSALWSVLFNENISYLSPPNGWASYGQRIRSVSDILNYKTAACLDTSVLFASCLENMGLNPIVAMTKEHAFAGFWLIDETMPLLTNDDAMDLRKRIASSDIVMFETTLVTNDNKVTFNQAIDYAKELLSEDNEDNFVMLIDIKQARSRGIKPLATIEEKAKLENEVETISELELGTIPVLPAVRVDERIIDETPKTRIELWQRKLLDLTKRNPLLNVKSSALKLYCPDLPTLEDRLASGEKFKFISSEESPLNDLERSTESFRLSTGNSLHLNFALQQLNLNNLIVNDTTNRTKSKLVELLRKAKNDMEEGGSNTLFISLGMLRWREVPESDKSYRAPLILLPVKLERKSAQANVTMRQLSDEEPIFNLTLIEMLQTDYDINLSDLQRNLPEDDSGVDVNKIWSIVRSAIAEQPGFEVVEEIVLGSFSFSKYLMWKDLTDRVDLLKQNPFVEHLVEHPSQAYQQDTEFIDQHEVDEKITPEEFYAPLNCDSSQMVAVEASSKEQDFVLEGPPGTGKSETITNMICHNLALGRKVLFVAEKMAALQVVYRRMEKVGLSHLCIELHSNKANKKGVLEQLNNAWSRRESASQYTWIERAKKLKEIRHSLNNYVHELHKKNLLGFSARKAMSRVVRYEKLHPLRLEWNENPEQAPVQTEEQVDKFLQCARELGIAFRDVVDIEQSVFSNVEQEDWSNQWRSDVVDLSRKLVNATTDSINANKELLEVLDIQLNTISLSSAEHLANVLELCQLSMDNNLEFVFNGRGKETLSQLNSIQDLNNELHSLINDFGHGLSFKHLNENPWQDWIQKRNEATGIFGFIKRWNLHSAIKKTGLSKIDDLSKLEQAIDAKVVLTKITQEESSLETSKVWLGIEMPKEKLAKDIEAGKRALKIYKNLVSLANDAIEASSKIRRLFVDGSEFITTSSNLYTASKKVKNKYEALTKLAEQSNAQQVHVDRELELNILSDQFKNIIDNSEKLNRWCHWLSAKKDAHSFELLSLAESLENHLIKPDECEDNALTALCIWIAPRIIDRSESLSKFIGSSHDDTIGRFRELDREVSETTSQYIIAKTAGKVPDRDSKDTPKEYGVLARELAKKQRHKPVRALVNEMGESLTDLTPCFMMSPLSVAQFLPADFDLFDLIIFDEASQITTWDAVGTIARGKNVIVVGDPKQMPPSNNFGRKDDDDSDEADLESILDQALAARLPHRRLTGHYRSRHETLIAFSNSHYYENELTTFPSAETKESAVVLHRVDGVYAKGKSQTNSKEAQAVVNEVVRRLEMMLHGAKRESIGIVTINSNQQRMVEDFMDEARRHNPHLEEFFVATDTYEPVFVKNLESVQGDERDIIILSLTYGPTELGSRTMSMNFGPLNKLGGERRLNVAITRATTEVLVFSSFDSSMVDLSRTKAIAVEHLKNYLEFAERGPVALSEFATANYGVDQFDSDFEQSVAMALREKGWKVQTQVGVTKFRIDLGIVHPDHPGEYLAGIECDGATYHGSPSARDRDRVRQVILEDLGWKIIRLWSTDYFNEPEFALKKILNQLDEALIKDHQQREEAATKVQDNGNLESRSIIDTEDVEYNEYNKIQETTDYMSEKQIANQLHIEEQAYNKDLYFNKEHADNLNNLAKDILEHKNGTTLHELALDIAKVHGLSRTSRKQIEYLLKQISKWAGIRQHENAKTTVWKSTEDILDEIPWRGLNAFGEERSFEDLPYEEQIGIARVAILKGANDPINWLFNEFKISRRHNTTIQTFQEWIDRLKK